MRYPSKPTTGLAFDPATILGALLALYFLIGRWTFGRLTGDHEFTPLYSQPRTWVIAAILVLAGLIYSELRHRGVSRLYGIDLALGAWIVYMLLSALWAPASPYLADKVAEVIMLAVVALSIALARSPWTSSRMHLGFWWGLVGIGAAMGFFTLAMNTAGRVYIPTGGPNIFGRNMGLVGVGALMLASTTTSWSRVGYYAIVAMAPMWVVMSGSRGALLALCVAGSILLLTSKARLTTKIVAVVLLATGAVGVFLGTESGRNALLVFEHRIVEQTLEQRYTADRDALFTEAWRMGLESPAIGWGLSGYRANSWTYPHNIVLETFSEGGTIGLVLFIGLFVTWWLGLKRSHKKVPGTIYAAMALFFTSACFSGNFYDSRGVLLYLAISVAPLVSYQALPVERPFSEQRVAIASKGGLART